MTLPSVRDLFAPILKLAKDKKEFHKREIYEPLAEALKLTIEQQQETLSSGENRFINRVHWSLSWLKLTGYLEQTGTSRFQISHKGIEAVKNLPANFGKIVVQEYNKLNQQTLVSKQVADSDTSETLSPVDKLEQGYNQLQETLQLDLLERIQRLSPAFFESLIVKLLIGMGYGGSQEDAGQAIGRSNDGGIDGIIKQDPLGLDEIYLQAKRWKGNVGSPEIINFMGALTLKNAHKGVFITTSDFTQDAIRQAQSPMKKVILINGQELTRLMIQYNVGVVTRGTYFIKDADEDFFSES